MNEGFVKLHRKSLKSSVFKTPIIFMVWCWCLMKASHEDQKFPFNGTDTELKKGQFITGLKKAEQELPLTRQNIRTAWNYLKSTHRITIKSTNRFSVISILNWEAYQGRLTNELTSKLTNHQQTTNKPLTTYKKVKNDKNIPTVAGKPADPLEKEINSIIPLFEPVNPTYKAFYSNNTQRAALKWLLKEFGRKKLEDMIKALPEIINRKFAPKVTTPLELKNDLGKLKAFAAQERSGKKINIVKIS